MRSNKRYITIDMLCAPQAKVVPDVGLDKEYCYSKVVYVMKMLVLFKNPLIYTFRRHNLYLVIDYVFDSWTKKIISMKC